jgi:hypothetical protein
MDNLNLAILNEIMEDQHEEKEAWTIKNNSDANWALETIAEHKKEMTEYISICEDVIKTYQEKIRKRKQQYDYDTARLQNELREYFETVKHEIMATKDVFKLPAGSLEMKKGTTIKKDVPVLVKWLKENKLTDYVKSVEDVDWAGLKKKIKFTGENAIDENGEIIPGIDVKEKEREFVINI